MEDLFTLLVRLVLIVVAIHALALVLVDVLDDVVDNVPFTGHLLRLDLRLRHVGGPGPVLVPVGDHTEHEVLLRRLVILHLALFENLLVLELIVPVHDAVGAAHHDIGFRHAFGLHDVVHVVFVVLVVALLALIDVVEIVHAWRATWRPSAGRIVSPTLGLLFAVVATLIAPTALRRGVASFLHIAGAAAIVVSAI